jgi:hypothetical protein
VPGTVAHAGTPRTPGVNAVRGNMRAVIARSLRAAGIVKS